jgi:amino acid transporter
MTEKQKTFVREATGLVREISAYRTFVFNIMNTGPAFMLIFLVVGQGLFPGAYLPVSSILVLIPAVLLAYVYAQMSTVFPRSGGDYIFVGRIIHPSLGFVVNFVMFMIQGSIIGVLAVWITTYALGPMFNGLGLLYSSPAYASLGSALVTPSSQFIVAAIAILLTTAILFFGVNITFKVNNIFWIVSLVSLLVFLGVAATTPASTFSSNFNSLSSTSYSQYVSAATGAGANLSYSLSDTFLAVIFTLLAVWGFTFSSYVGGEVRNPQKSQLYGMMLSAGVYIAIMTGVTLVAYYTFGHDFLASIGYLSVSGNSAYALPSALPTMQFLVTYITKSPLMEVVMSVGLLASLLAVCGTILPFVQIRMLFSWSFDRLLPSKFADVNAKYHVPHYALLFMIIVNLVFVGLAIYTPFASYFTYNVTGSLFIAGIVGLAAALLPRRRKEIFESSPPFVSRKVGGLPLISILGILLLIIGWAIAYASLLPALVGPLNPFYIGFVVALFVAGFAVYWIAHVIQKSRGIPVDIILSEIPPE